MDEEGLRFMRRGEAAAGVEGAGAAEEESGGATEREAPQSESER